MKLPFDDRGATRGTALLAGLAGGAAEIAWVVLYGGIAQPGIAADLARQVTASVLPMLANLSVAPLIGVAIHMALSAVLGLAFGWALWRYLRPILGADTLMPAAIATLALVWAANFFVVLPLINPEFVTLMPYGAALVSKLLFGATMALVIRRSASGRQVRS